MSTSGPKTEFVSGLDNSYAHRHFRLSTFTFRPNFTIPTFNNHILLYAKTYDMHSGIMIMIIILYHDTFFERFQSYVYCCRTRVKNKYRSHYLFFFFIYICELECTAVGERAGRQAGIGRLWYTGACACIIWYYVNSINESVLESNVHTTAQCRVYFLHRFEEVISLYIHTVVSMCGAVYCGGVFRLWSVCARIYRRLYCCCVYANDGIILAFGKYLWTSTKVTKHPPFLFQRTYGVIWYSRKSYSIYAPNVRLRLCC